MTDLMVFYTIVTSIDRQVNVRFSSKEPLLKFIQSLNKELHPKHINDNKSTYQTHVQGKGCTLTTDSKVASIYITGPAQKTVERNWISNTLSVSISTVC